MLLSKDDIPQRETPEADDELDYVVRIKAGKTRTMLAPKDAGLPELIGVIEMDEVIHIATRGNWSTPHLIAFILNQIGPAKVWLTSWSVKEQAVRILLGLADEGLITELHALFDERTKVQCPQAYQLAQNQIVDIRLTKIHAKVSVIMNNDWGISIVTSANLTRNPRIERFAICMQKAVAEFDLGWIQQEIDKKKPFGV